MSPLRASRPAVIGALLALTLDRAVKAIATNVHPALEQGAGFFYNVNTAGPLSLPLPAGSLLLLGGLALAVLLYMSWRAWRGAQYAVFFGALLMMVGGMSNVFDRIVTGGVIDTYYLTLWGTLSFNLADLWLVSGLVLVSTNWRPAARRVRP